MQRMNFVKHRGSTLAKAKLSDEKLRKSYLLQIKGMADRCTQNPISAWDQAGVKLMPSSNWTLEQEGAERVKIAGLDDKHQVTVTLAGTLLGELQILYQGKTDTILPRNIQMDLT